MNERKETELDETADRTLLELEKASGWIRWKDLKAKLEGRIKPPISGSTGHRRIDQMMELGLVERKMEEDRWPAAVFYRITPKGLVYVAKKAPEFTRIAKSYLDQYLRRNDPNLQGPDIGEILAYVKDIQKEYQSRGMYSYKKKTDQTLGYRKE